MATTAWSPGRLALAVGLLFSCAAPGCSQFRQSGPPPQLPNPLEIPVSDPEFAWNTIVDTVDDYFEIAREERVHLIGDVLTEGHIETRAAPAATVLEPWRRDRTPGFELWQGTFQSIRRFAEVTVSPSSAGYGVQVIVRKELEDVARPEWTTTGSVMRRYDGSLTRPTGKRIGGPLTLGWIALGRDIALEQKILADLYARMYNTAPPPPVMTLHN